MIENTKEEFLKKLESGLMKYYPLDEVKEICKDYEDFFNQKLKEHKSEREICVEFGEVKDIVKEIVDGKPIHFIHYLGNRTVGIFVLILLIFIGGLSLQSKQIMSDFIFYLFSGFMILVTGYVIAKRATKQSVKVNKNVLIMGVGFIGFFISYMAILLFLSDILSNIDQYQNIIPIQNVGPMIDSIFTVYLIIAAIFMYFGLDKAKVDRRFAFIVFGSMLIMSSIMNMFSILMQMSDPNAFISTLVSAQGLLLGINAVASIGSLYWIFKRGV